MARVLFLVDSCRHGGERTALLSLLRLAERTRREAVVVSLLPPGGGAVAVREAGVEILSPGIGGERGALAALELAIEASRLPRLLGGRRFTLVHSFGERSHLLGRLAAPRVGARAVVNTWRGEGAGGRASRSDRWTAGRVTRFHLPSASLLEPLRRRLGVGPERCAVIPEGVDLARADAALAVGREEARRRLGLFPTDLAVAWVGRLDAGRGLQQLVAAFHALLQAHPTARLLLAGDGPLRGSLEAAVAGLRLGPFARFLGAVPEPWPLLAAADVFALPAAGPVPPAALLEAMAARLPCVAAAAGAVPEVAEDGREVLLVPAGDPGALARALADLAASPSRRREMGALARARVERAWRAADTAAALERLSDELAAG